MDLGIDNRAAIVTGASKGIGLAIALELAKEGASVAICARGAQALEAAAEQLRAQTGRPIMAMAADVTDQPAVARFVEAAAAAHGGIDILVNNAGSPVTGTFEEVELEDWRADLDVKLFAAIYCIRAALPFLKQSDQARIININSIVGKQSTPEYIANSVDRAACLGFNKVLSDNLAKYGILVNSVNPAQRKERSVGQHARLLCARLRAGGLVRAGRQGHTAATRGGSTRDRRRGRFSGR